MVTLHDIMSLEVQTVTPQTTLREVAELFAGYHISGAPVVSGDLVVGVLSATDLLGFDAESRGVPTRKEARAGVAWENGEEWHSSEDAPAAFFADLWVNAGADVRARLEVTDAPEWNVLEEHTAEELMTRSLCALPPTTPVREAAESMLRAGVHRILVMDDGELLGVVTTTDIVKAVAQHGLGG
jgi:CBS domain-containing protein